MMGYEFSNFKEGRVMENHPKVAPEPSVFREHSIDTYRATRYLVNS